MSGRVVFVTGGVHGIGWAVCRRFAAAKARVVIADVDGAGAQARARDLGTEALGLACDVTSSEDGAAAIAATMARFGRLDVLINNAGVIDSTGTPALETPLAAFCRLLEVNLVGAYRLASSARAVMSSGGVIVNLASAAGYVATPLRTGYAASKAGMVGLTRALGRDWAADHIRVNAVAPGYVRTALMDKLIAAGKIDPRLVASRVPLSRIARPEEIAEVIFHVASTEAGCASGTSIVADGGFLAAGGSGPFGGPRPDHPVVPPSAGRVVAVVGGKPRLGAAIASALIADGDRVMLFGSNETELKAVTNTLGPKCRYVVGRTIDEASMGRFMESATAAFGRLNALVSIPDGDPSRAMGARNEFSELTESVAATFVADKAFGASIQASGCGAIVNLAFGCEAPADIEQETSAGAIAMLSRSLACEWAAVGIRVNAVILGALDGFAAAAATIKFLLSDAASYVTGAEIVCGHVPS